MSEQYTGWNLFDKVIIVAKPIIDWDSEAGIMKPNDSFQGHIVDPKNKSMLKTARRWGGWIEYPERSNLRNSITHKPEEYFYDNDGFTLSLCDAADSSSQGGKLSFWNCNITAPDGQTFLVGIAANLLLDVLKNNTTINGVVQTPLCFARKNGQVGMLSTNMEAYQLAIKDMQRKENMSICKTKDHIMGHIYETITLKNIYLGRIYKWYKPIYDDSQYNRRASFRGLRKLETPVESYLFPNYVFAKNKLSDYIGCHSYDLNITNKVPARKLASEIIELDISIQEFLDLNALRHIDDSTRWQFIYDIVEYVGYSDDPYSYTIPQNVRDIIINAGYTIED